MELYSLLGQLIKKMICSLFKYMCSTVFGIPHHRPTAIKLKMFFEYLLNWNSIVRLLYIQLFDFCSTGLLLWMLKWLKLEFSYPFSSHTNETDSIVKFKWIHKRKLWFLYEKWNLRSGLNRMRNYNADIGIGNRNIELYES